MSETKIKKNKEEVRGERENLTCLTKEKPTPDKLFDIFTRCKTKAHCDNPPKKTHSRKATSGKGKLIAPGTAQMFLTNKWGSITLSRPDRANGMKIKGKSGVKSGLGEREGSGKKVLKGLAPNPGDHSATDLASERSKELKF